jgi:hypothetical protein
MSLRDYVDKASLMLDAWHAELAERRPRRSQFAAAMRHALFTDNDAGWLAYTSKMQSELAWFACGSR